MKIEIYLKLIYNILQKQHKKNTEKKKPGKITIYILHYNKMKSETLVQEQKKVVYKKAATFLHKFIKRGYWTYKPSPYASL